MNPELTITLVIVIVTALISYRGFGRPLIIERLKHSPYLEAHKREWYRVITSGFVHADWIHLLVNMYVLYEFGRIVELQFGEWFGPAGKFIYLAMYILGIAAGALPSIIKERDNMMYAAIGASGAVSGVVFIFIMLYPWAMLGIMFIIPMPAIVAGVGYLIYSGWAARRNRPGFGGRMIGHSAHLWGALFGVLFVSVVKPEVLFAFINQLIHPVF